MSLSVGYPTSPAGVVHPPTASPALQTSQDSGFPKALENGLGCPLRRHTCGVDLDLRSLWHFVWRIDPSKVLQLAAPGLLVQPLGIPCLSHFEWHVDEHLVELPFPHQSARGASLRPKRRNERYEH